MTTLVSEYRSLTMPRRRKRSCAAQQREQKKLHPLNFTLQNDTQMTNNTNKPDLYKVISGTLHQGNTRFQSPGIQCAYISLIALIRMTHKDPQSWTSAHVDSCVIDGNAKFLKHCEALDIQPKMLMANELPNTINISQKCFVCKHSESNIEVGLLKPSMCGPEECVAQSIENALLKVLQCSQTCLFFLWWPHDCSCKCRKSFLYI